MAADPTEPGSAARVCRPDPLVGAAPGRLDRVWGVLSRV